MKPACPLCNAPRAALCLERSSVPVFQNIRYPTAPAAKAAAAGRLAIAHCERCGFVFNAAFDPQLAVYTASYENDQTLSGHFRGYLKQIGAGVMAAVDGKVDPMVLEVGCGQAAFLKQLAQLPQARYSRFLGFDPAWRGGDMPSMVEVRPSLFDAAMVADLDSPIDAVVSRHVIEHIADPIGFLQDIRRAIGTTARPKLMLETPCLEWIVAHDVLFDFFYEHCSYFTLETLHYALARAGWRVLKIERMFDGQYLWAEAEPAPGAAITATPPAPIGLGGAIAAIGRNADARLATWCTQLAPHRGRGTLALWGAGAKGATLAALTDQDGTLIDCLIDINPRKQGGYVAVTGHPVVAPIEAAARGVRAAVLMNPNYRAEVLDMIETAPLPFTLVDGP